MNLKPDFLLQLIAVTTFFLIAPVDSVFSWGANGHRIIGQIAYNHLSEHARERINDILDGESIAMVSNYMDEIKSLAKYRYMSPWHYCTIPDGESYEEAGTPEEGDVIMAINKFISDLQSKSLSQEEEAFALKCLIHLVGDIHMPLHVGNGTDRGGNDVDVFFFGEEANLHWVWDTGMIEHQKLSYTEYTEWIDHPSQMELEEWMQDDIMEWANESVVFRKNVYNLPVDKKLSYDYIFENKSIVNRRLLQAGIRLAGLLNQIYG